jgi:nitrite reductase/ring-hydroxylating ferredoxin subunit
MTFLCDCDDIPNNSSRGFEVNGESLFVVHYQQQFYAYRNHCPHLGLELNWQPDQFLTVDNNLIQCSTHGALFLIEDGECVSGPCSGQALEAIPFTIENKKIKLPA